MRRSVVLAGAAAVTAFAGAALAAVGRLGTMPGYLAAAASLRRLPAPPADLHDMIRYATLAASGHNAQPWGFRIGHDGVDIEADWSRRTPAVDPDDHHLHVSLGCAIENFVLAAQARGYEPTVQLRHREAVSVTLHKATTSGDPLVAAIPLRRSNRAIYDGTGATPGEVDSLLQASRRDGVDVVALTSGKRLGELGDLCASANTAQLGDAAFVRELQDWIRFNPRQALERGDGLFSPLTGNPIVPTWLGRLVFERVMQPRAQAAIVTKAIRSSSGVAVFAGASADPHHWIEVGRSAQRFALKATTIGLQCAFVNQPVEVAALRPELAVLAGFRGRRPDLMIRFGHAPEAAFSLRRPLAAAMSAGVRSG